jgi:histidyl-tRNA synthetase
VWSSGNALRRYSREEHEGNWYYQTKEEKPWTRRRESGDKPRLTIRFLYYLFVNSLMFQPPRGTRDYLPEDQMKKEWVIDRVREVYETYGYEPLGTPAFEYLDLLTVKSGEAIIEQIYNFKDKSDRELALRFELTASTARVVASHRELQKPFKRYAIGATWRYERPSETRFREFIQADVDIFGVESSIADAEVLSAVVDALSRLGFKDYTILVNDRRILRSIVSLVGVPDDKCDTAFRAVDKLAKIGKDGVIGELEGITPDTESSKRLLDLLSLKGEPSRVIEETKKLLEGYPEGEKGCDSILELYKYAESFGFSQYLVLDLSLARGLDYYTGPVFEIHSKEFPEYGSLAGGGRYDKLIELFGGEPTPATGVSFGIDRITPVLDKIGAFKELSLGAQVYVAPVNSKLVEKAIEITQLLRTADIPSTIDMMGRKLGKQFEYADKKGISKVVVVGQKDLADESVTVRDMKTGDQEKVKLVDLVKHLQ